MRDEQKTKRQLVEELATLRKKLAAMESTPHASLRKLSDAALRNSEERYRFIVDNLKEVVFQTDAHGHWTFLNPAWTEVTGFELHESLGKFFLDFVHPDDRRKNLELFRPLIEKQKDFCRHEIRYLHKNGGFRHIEVWARLILDAKGNATGTAGTLSDITERVQAEQQRLRDLELRYRTLIEQLPDGIYRSTPEGKFLEVNSALVKMLGYASKEELLNINIKTELYFDPQEREAVIESLHQAGKEEIDVFRLRRKGGEEIWVEDHGRLVCDDNGSVLYHEGILRDVTERRMMDQKLLNTLSLLQSTLESTGDGILVVDNDGKITSFNQKFLEMWGIPSQIIDARDDNLAVDFVMKQLIAPEVFLNKIRELYSQPEAESHDVLEFKDGRIFERYSQPQRMGKSIVGRVWSFRDVTERKQAEQQMQKHLTQLQSIYQLNEFVSRAERLEDIYEEALNRLNLTLFADRVSILLFDDDGVMRFKAWHGLSEKYRQAVVGHSPWSPGAQNPQPIVISNVEDDESFSSLRDTILQEGIRAIGFIPLVHEGNLLGKFMIYYNKPHEFCTEEIRLAQTIAGHVAFAIAQKKSADALNASTERYRRLFDDNPSMYFTVDGEGRVLAVNKFGAQLLGFQKEELIGKPVTLVVFEQDHAQAAHMLKECFLHRGKVFRWEFRKIRKDGSLLWVKESLRAVEEADGVTVALMVCEDISEQKQLEAQYLHAQKMEAIGRLAGGVAHDFNNLLTAIIGYADVVRLALDKHNPIYDDIQQILNASERAKDLTHQLLAFSRKQVLEMKILNLNATVSGIEKMLRRLIGEDIELVTELQEPLHAVKGDPSQIGQIIINLAINARDAMPDGGTLTIRTDNVNLDDAYARTHPEVQPGPYVLLWVCDTGLGMDSETISHVFEPFFTTKEVGKGTGLGLATIYGIVKQHSGHITVESQLGVGTCFKIFLPVASEEEKPEKVGMAHAAFDAPRTAKVLVVEDEEMVRQLTAKILRSQGYSVIEAGKPQQAIALATEQTGHIDLLFTDVVMPEMSGKELYVRLQPIIPDLKVLYTSGHTEEVITRHGVLEPNMLFLQKPYTVKALLQKVRMALASVPD